MSTTHALFVERAGDTWEFTGPLNDNSGNPLPLTGATITWKLDSLDLTTNYLTLTLGFGITVTDLTTATVQYGPTEAQTAGLIPGTYYDTLSVTLSSGNGGGKFTCIEGLINVEPEAA